MYHVSIVLLFDFYTASENKQGRKKRMSLMVLGQRQEYFSHKNLNTHADALSLFINVLREESRYFDTLLMGSGATAELNSPTRFKLIIFFFFVGPLVEYCFAISLPRSCTSRGE